MKCISYKQPWATLVQLKEKRVETRSVHYTVLAGRWHAIHASNTWAADQRRVLDTEPFRTRLAHHGITSSNATQWNLPRGAIIGVAFVATIAPTIAVSITDQERAFGDYAKGRWAYHLGDVFALAEPVIYCGRLGVWDLPAAIERKVLVQLQQFHDDLPAGLTSEDLLNEAVNQARLARLKQQEVNAAVHQLNYGRPPADRRTPIDRLIDKAVGRG